MTSDDTTPDPAEDPAEADEAPRPAKKAARKGAKKGAKRAARKTAAKRTANPGVSDAASPESGAAPKDGGGDAGDEVTGDALAAAAAAEAAEERPSSESAGAESKSEGQPQAEGGQAAGGGQGGRQGPQERSRPAQQRGGGGPQGPKKGGFNNKKNRKKQKKGGASQAKKGRRPQPEEGAPLELGELPDDPLFESLDQIESWAEDLRSGGGEPLDFNRLYNLALPELRAEAEALDADIARGPNRERLIGTVLEHARARKRPIEAVGVLDVWDDEDQGAVLTYEGDSYRVKALCAYVAPRFVQRHGLQPGHVVRAQLHPPRPGESCPFVVRVLECMGRDPDALSGIVPFTECVPYYPLDRILLETSSETAKDNLSMRVVDCLTPVGFGQRGLIVSPPRAGKTMLLQGMAHSIQTNYPDAHLIILLIDERPEEVTDFRRQVNGEVVASTFDESAESHVHAAEMVIEKARRMVEVERDVVILLDSITRLARAYNTTMPSSGKILSGGVEANALQRPKRFFGSARNIEDGGSLTIIATALVETGSKMDEVIFEEFKGTGNMELHLDRGLSDKRIFPALSMDRSGTRKEELLYHPDEMQKIYSLRRAMKGVPSADAMEMLIQRIKKTQTNAEFLMSVAR